ncbi:MAG TPA: PKD domain-containing protein [Chitinophagales bacterium]|nr:PKD domain-containing protein [Chitinophagales bacterium]
MRQLLSTLLFLTALIINGFAGEACSSCSSIIFKQNNGQWESQIKYKAEIKNGAIFFEKNAITFNLFDTRDILRIKGDHHRLEDYKPTIDYTLHFHAFKMKFENSSEQVKTSGTDAIKEYFSYFIGNDKSKWASRVPAFTQVDYSNLYNGIKLVVSSKDRALKYVYEVEKGIDVSQLKVNFEGTNGLAIDEKGNLNIKTAVGDIMDLKPYAYQLVNGRQVEVACLFSLKGNTLAYDFPKGYDKSLKLFIDPTLIFSTYSGSTADNFGYSATYDSKENAFAAGSVFGTGYPVTTGAYDMVYTGGATIVFSGGGTYPGDDIAITKYSADGTQRLFSTYLGGFGQDLPHSLIANSSDELYILGTTDCPDYPTSTTAYDRTFNGGTDPGVFDGIAAHYTRGSDIVISRLSVDGTQLLSSTYVGGSSNDGLNYTAGQPYSVLGVLRHNYADEVRGEIEIDKNNNIYIASCTRSADFPRTTGSFQAAFGGEMDACIFKMDANLTTMIWSTTFGGNDDDAAYSVAVDGDENLFVAGGTTSPNFPVTAGVYQPAFAGGTCDGFISHIDKNGQVNIASTYFGFNEYEQNYFVDLDKANNVYVLGQADNSNNNFIKNAAFNQPDGGQFISKFNEALDTLIWSTSFGRGLGVTDISPTAFLVDVCRNIYACGWGSQGVNSNVSGTGGTNGLPVTPNAFKATTDGEDFYLMVMRDDASALTYATFMGGNGIEEHVDGGTSRFDRKGKVYQSVCAGCGGSDNFPTTPGAVSNTNNSTNCNNAIFKFDIELPICLADFTYPNACGNIPVQFTNQSTSVNPPTFQWNFGDGNTSTQVNPVHTFSTSGLFDVTLIVNDAGSCNGSDTITKKILVIGGIGTSTLPPVSVCTAQSIQIGFPPINDTAVVYHWSPSTNLSSVNVSNPIASATATTTYQLLVSNGICVDTFYQTVNVGTDDLNITATPVICAGDTTVLSVASTSGNTFVQYAWSPAGVIIAGANTANPLAKINGNVTIRVTVQTPQGCQYTDSLNVVLPPPTLFDADFALPAAGCAPDTAQFTSTGTEGSGATYLWTFGDGTTSTLQNPVHIYTYGGAFNITLVVHDNSTCNKTDSVTKQLVLLGDTTYTLPPATICYGDTAQIGFSNTGNTYVWQPAATLNNPSISNPLAFPLHTTTYLLQISNGVCSDSIYQTVNVLFDSLFINPDTLVCSGSNVQLWVNHLNTSEPLVYNWSPDARIISGDSTANPTVFAGQATTFTVTAYNSYQCMYTASVTVSVFATSPNVIATADPDTITFGETSQLMADSLDANWLMWYPDSTLSALDIVNPVASPRETRAYVVEVRDENGCAKTDTVWVYLEHTPCEQTTVYIPNAFSPNADGKNDVLYVRANNVTQLYFAVYDRWGQKMFDTKDISKGWDGTFNGKKIDPAVFGWYAEGVCDGGNKFELKGNVTLIR